jgi:cytochrome b subunit of formate dehydrogenase
MYSGENTTRLYSVFHKNDTGRLILLIICNLTFVIPFLRTLKGYIAVRDTAWFLHPFVSFAFTVGYAVFFIKKSLYKTITQS